MSTMRTHRRATAGFTLVEMMVVLIIIALVVAFALPSYRSLVSDSRMAGEINDLKTDMEVSRSAAVKQGMYVTICQSPAPAASNPTCGGNAEWNTGWIAFTDTTNDQLYQPAQGDQLIRVHAALEGTDTLIGYNGVPTITFNRMGGVPPLTGAAAGTLGGGDITLRESTDNLGLQRCVVVSQEGTTIVDSAQTQNEGSCL